MRWDLSTVLGSSDSLVHWVVVELSRTQRNRNWLRTCRQAWLEMYPKVCPTAATSLHFIGKPRCSDLSAVLDPSAAHKKVLLLSQLGLITMWCIEHHGRAKKNFLIMMRYLSLFILLFRITLLVSWVSTTPLFSWVRTTYTTRRLSEYHTTGLLSAYHTTGLLSAYHATRLLSAYHATRRLAERHPSLATHSVVFVLAGFVRRNRRQKIVASTHSILHSLWRE